jgi:hypothetical protein
MKVKNPAWGPPFFGYFIDTILNIRQDKKSKYNKNAPIMHIIHMHYNAPYNTYLMHI